MFDKQKNPQKADSPSVGFSDLLVLIEHWCSEYYDIGMNGVGGNLHIVLDDGNLAQEGLEFCLDACIKDNDIFGKVLCKKLMKLTDEQLTELYKKYPYKKKYEH